MSLAARNLFTCRHFVINSDLLLSSEDFSAVKMDSFSASHRFERVVPLLHGVDLFNIDHLIECFTLLSCKTQMYLDRTVSCACLRCLNDILWVLYRDLKHDQVGFLCSFQVFI